MAKRSPQETYRLAASQLAAGRPQEAEPLYRQVLARQPENLAAYLDLGVALKQLGRTEEAIAIYRQALALRWNYFEAHNNLGEALRVRGRLTEAIETFHQALALKPDLAVAHNNLGLALVSAGRIEEGIGCYGRALALAPGRADIASNRLLALHFLTEGEAGQLFAEHRAWNERYGIPLRQFIRPHGNDRSPDRRLKIGYVSPDFREHSVAYFVESLFVHHDPAHVEVFCYADLRRPDYVTASLRQHVQQWQNITAQSDEQVAEKIRGDEIDILVDLAGHTAGNRMLMFARKPAPVQVTYVGYPNTTGLTAMDYRLSDAGVDPAGNERLCSEELVRLPHGFLCFCGPEYAPEAGPLPALGSGHITFGCFNVLQKINREVAAVWSEILRRTPNSRLVIKNVSLSDAALHGSVLEIFAREGIGASRLDLRGRISARVDHLASYQEIDIALDTFPYNGTTTTCEAMWMGTPAIALAGQSHRSRVGVSLLTNIGLAELIGATPERYIQIATDLAGDLPKLQLLRGSLRERMRSSPLLDGRQFARDIEAVYRQMWRKWCEAAGLKKGCS